MSRSRRKKPTNVKSFLAPIFCARGERPQLLYGRRLARFTVHRLVKFASLSSRGRHGFESGEQILRAKRAENFFDPHFLASGGQNIAQMAKLA